MFTRTGQRKMASLAGIAALGLSLIGTSGCQKQSAAGPPQMPPPDVAFVSVQQKDVPIYGDWTGSLDGFVNAQIQPQVSGYLVKQNYREGSLVHKGDVLFEIDPRPFQAVLDQAKGQLSQAKGQVAQAQAQLALTDINVARDTPLSQARAIAKSQLDNDVQGRASAQAQVQTGQASIESAQASIEQAELNLGFTKVHSLIDGIAGIATVQMGNLVSQTTVLTTVSQVNPIKVYFPISEQEYLRVAGKIKTGNGRDFLKQSNSVPLQLTLANGDVYPQKGHIVFTDRQVDTSTGTIRVVGAFPNPGNVLRPGQFGRVRALTAMNAGALLVPQRAVTELQGKYQVAVVTAGNKISIRNVQPGERVGTMWIIKSGLSMGERVVTEGTLKVRDGSPVNPKLDPSVSPKPNPSASEGA